MPAVGVNARGILPVVPQRIRRSKEQVCAAKQVRKAKEAHDKKHRAIEARKAKVRSVKKRFDRAHAEGTERLDAGDYTGLGQAVKDEAQAIEDFRKLTETKRQPSRGK
jgi:hypothetical protein